MAAKRSASDAFATPAEWPGLVAGTSAASHDFYLLDDLANADKRLKVMETATYENLNFFKSEKI